MNKINKTNEELIQEWVEELETAENSERTVITYATTIRQFSKFINKSLLEVERDDVARFLNYKDVKAVTKRNRQAIISTFYNWVIKIKRYMREHPLSEWISIKIPKRQRQYLTPENYQKIKLYLQKQPNYKKSRVHYMLFFLAFSTGLRAHELVKLTVEDIDFGKNCLKTIGKGNVERIVGFHHNLTSYILQYLNRNGIETGYIFPKKINNFSAGHITSNAFNKLCAKITKDTGIHVYPHLERHGYAMNFLGQQGASIEVLKKQFGHTSIKTTLIYAEASNDRLLAETSKYSPDPCEYI